MGKNFVHNYKNPHLYHVGIEYVGRLNFFYYIFLGHNYFNMINLELCIQLRFSVFEV